MTFKFYTANGEVEAIESDPFTICAPGEWTGFDPNTPMVNVGNNTFCYTVASPGTYQWKPVVCGGFDSWQPSNGERSVNSANWEITTIVENSQVCVTYNQANGRVGAATIIAVPTMGQWAFIIFSLIMVALGMVIVRQQKLVLAGNQNTSFSFRNMPFDKVSFQKSLGLVGLSLVLIFGIAVTFFGYEMTNADIPGSLLSMPLVAYIIMLLVKDENK